MRHMQRLALFALVAVLSACASTPAQRTSGSADPNVILEAELATYADRPVVQAIQRLRPQFLRTRGVSSVNRTAVDVVVVYLGGTRMGGPEALEQIRTADVREIRYLSPSDASQRFGLNHSNGAIILTPK